MRMPKLPYTGGKTKRETTRFLGIDWNDDAGEGALRDSIGLSARRYPCLAQRSGREKLDGYTAPTDLFAWDDKLVVVDGGVLYYDGEALDNVTPGEKQFAVVNTKLCIWPDKSYIDLTNGEYGHLDAAVETTDTPGSVTVTTNSIRADLHVNIASNLTRRYLGGSFLPTVYTYGSSKAAIDACWNNGAWDETALERLESLTQIDAVQGKILIPQHANNAFYPVSGNAEYVPEQLPDKTKQNSNGYYAVVTNVKLDLWERTARGLNIDVTITLDVYCAVQLSWRFNDFFKPGDAVTISNLTYNSGVYSVEKAVITDIQCDANNNKLVFANNTIPSGAYVENGKIVTIRREVPDLDFICESGNRLWGVANSGGTRTIYASALGDPTAFWSFEGTSADSWQLAVGSEGDFTGICAYGGGVCCWKEKLLHKIGGSYPAEYYMSDYQIAGVKQGCHRSMQTINEVLYYLGPDGVYAYTGSVPRRISDALGRGRLSGGVGGTDGSCYYLSAKNARGEALLLAYDLRNGLWMKEDALEARAFARTEDAAYLLAGGAVYKTGQDNGERVKWLAEFAPFEEKPFSKSGYTKLLLRLDMGAESYIMAEISEDGAPWKHVWTQRATARALTFCIPIRIGRCDRFALRLSGEGDVVLRSLAREFTEGSEYGQVY